MNGNFGYEDKRGNGGGYEERRGGKDAVSEFDVRGKGSDRGGGGQRAVDRGGGSERRKGEGSDRRAGYGEERREGGDVRADFDARQRPFEPSEVRIPSFTQPISAWLPKITDDFLLPFSYSNIPFSRNL